MMAARLPLYLLRLVKKIAARVLIVSGLDSLRYKRDYKRKKINGDALEDPALVDGYKDEGEVERVEKLVELILSQVPHPRAVLDIGCGTGRYLRQLQAVSPDSVLEGIDISAEILDKYARPMVPGAQFHALDIETDRRFFRRRESSFDLICLIGIIQVVARRKVRTILRKVHHMCNDGGVAYIQFNVETAKKKSSCGYRRYSVEEISALLEECSFQVIKSGRTDILADYAYVFARKHPATR